MARLRLFNPKFNLDYDRLAVEEALVKKFINSPEEVKFHLECCVAAFDHENGLIYLPHPRLYFEGITEEDITALVNHVRGNVSEIVDGLANAVRKRHRGTVIWKNFLLRQLTSKYDSSIAFLNFLNFTLFTCDLKLANCSHKLSGSAALWMVECSPEKEKHFAAQAGPVTYLIHRTYPECMYSIVRNGIMSMSHEQEGGFMKTGAQYGPGIYLSTPGKYKHNINASVVLCYTVKGANRHSDSPYIFVVQEDQVCLRAILWNQTNPIDLGVERSIADGVQDLYKAVRKVTIWNLADVGYSCNACKLAN